jgi:hypothetical protein
MRFMFSFITFRFEFVCLFLFLKIVNNYCTLYFKVIVKQFNYNYGFFIISIKEYNIFIFLLITTHSDNYRLLLF